jgi:drug/metabolite transporter (DMT)-like permease
LAGRRGPVPGIVLITQTSGMVVALVLFVIRGEPMPGLLDVGWSVATGVAGVIGISALYAGLAAGRMSIVAPVTGVLAATIPVAVGIVLEGLPGAEVLIGIGLALAAVVLVSRVADEGSGPSGLPYAMVAGVGLGLFNVLIAQVTPGLVFGPLAILRATQALIIVGFIVVAGAPWRLRRSLVPAVLLVGVLDMAGNAFFIAARQAGELAVAATLSSLYPVTTTILAAVILRERIGRVHAVGIVAAGIAVALIAAGAAGSG